MEAVTVLRELELLEIINNSNISAVAKMDLYKLIEFHSEFRVVFDESD
jgi:hypothetical protein